jgi:hypothetical protein
LFNEAHAYSRFIKIYEKVDNIVADVYNLKEFKNKDNLMSYFKRFINDNYD